MISATDIARFLRTDAAVARIDFSLASIKFYPSAFRKDVADACDKGVSHPIAKKVLAALNRPFSSE